MQQTFVSNITGFGWPRPLGMPVREGVSREDYLRLRGLCRASPHGLGESLNKSRMEKGKGQQSTDSPLLWFLSSMVWAGLLCWASLSWQNPQKPWAKSWIPSLSCFPHITCLINEKVANIEQYVWNLSTMIDQAQETVGSGGNPEWMKSYVNVGSWHGHGA